MYGIGVMLLLVATLGAQLVWTRLGGGFSGR